MRRTETLRLRHSLYYGEHRSARYWGQEGIGRIQKLISQPVSPKVDAISTVELAPHPAEFGNRTASTSLWKSQKLVGGKRTLAQWTSLSGQYEVRTHKRENPV